MKSICTSAILATVLLLTVGPGCSKSSTAPPDNLPPAEDWTFPADASKFALTPYAASTSVTIGEAFDVKIVCYNMSQVFGAAVEFSYPGADVEIDSVLAGPYLPASTSVIHVSHVDAGTSSVSFGATYIAGSGPSPTGSGVLCKFKCKGTAAGTGSFTIRTLQIVRSDGSPIPNIVTLVHESLSVTVH